MHEGPMPRMRSWRRLARVSGRRCKLTGDVGVPHREHTAWVALADPRMQPPEPEVVVLRELHAKQHGCGLISAVDGVGDPHREHTAWVALADPRMQPPEPEVVVLRELHAKQHGCGLISAVDGVGDDILDAHELHRAILL